MTPLTKFPDADAPLSAWLAPLSATMQNVRAVPLCSTSEAASASSAGGLGAKLAAMRRPAAAPRKAPAKPRVPRGGVHDEAIARMALAGYPVTEISREVGMGRGGVSKVIARLGLGEKWRAARKQSPAADEPGGA